MPGQIKEPEVESRVAELQYVKNIKRKTCPISIPGGVKHCPVIYRRVDTPIFMFEAGNDTKYEKSEEKTISR